MGAVPGVSSCMLHTPRLVAPRTYLLCCPQPLLGLRAVAHTRPVVSRLACWFQPPWGKGLFAQLPSSCLVTEALCGPSSCQPASKATDPYALLVLAHTCACDLMRTSVVRKVFVIHKPEHAVLLIRSGATAARPACAECCSPTKNIKPGRSCL